MYEVIKNSDLVILLISDAAQAQLYKSIFAALKPGSLQFHALAWTDDDSPTGATLGLSHGFLLGYLESIGEKFPAGKSLLFHRILQYCI